MCEKCEAAFDKFKKDMLPSFKIYQAKVIEFADKPMKLKENIKPYLEEFEKVRDSSFEDYKKVVAENHPGG